MVHQLLRGKLVKIQYGTRHCDTEKVAIHCLITGRAADDEVKSGDLPLNLYSFLRGYEKGFTCV